MNETMFEILNKYSHTGQFEFRVDDNLRYVCNAPTDKSGVYIVWTNEQLLYIGRSGKKENGVIVHRKCGLGGIKDRLVVISLGNSLVDAFGLRK